VDRPSDPLLRAIADGDPACPDGRTLARLGALMRSHGPRPAPAALAARVAGRISAGRGAGPDADAVAAFYAGEAADPAQERLRSLIAGVRPAPADLRARVRARLAEGDSEPEQGGSRLRFWSAVVTAHLAAVLVLAVMRFGGPGTAGDGGGDGGGFSAARPPALPTTLPARWEDLRSGGDLYRLRRYPDQRALARSTWGMERSAGDVAAALRWLAAQQGADGAIGTLAGNPEHDAACQALAALALLGEGLGDAARCEAARRCLGWLAAHDAPGAGAGLAALALVEGGLLLNDPELKRAAELRVAGLEPALAGGAGAAGVGGFALLALESARQGGLAVPPRLLQQARRDIARALPADDRDPGRLGLAAFARIINGYRDNDSTRALVDALAATAPAPAADGSVDPLAWLFATWALREAGGSAWTRWAGALQDTLEPCFERADGLAHVPAARVRHAQAAGGAVFATAVTVLDLQAAYRWLPVAAR
jgi:hypothetical protein